jgi:pimeloyl-ACP methyl ester carboxylesterase
VTPYEIPGATHQVVEAGGVELSVYEAGDPNAPAVVFSHGFPELAYSWRHQLPALARAGFRAIAPDQRGYGGSSQPSAIGDYDIFHLTGDLVVVLDALDIDRAVFVGHDWGGFVVWQMPLLHRERVAGVAALTTPYVPRLPMAPTEVFRMMGGDDHYILWFQEPGPADVALADNVAALFDHMMRRAVDPDELRAAMGERAAADFVTGIVNAPIVGDRLLTDGELAVFVDTFTATGFTGGLNWYRNFDHNWEATPQLDGARIDGLPCLMITAEWDPVLVPAMAQGMPSVIDDLEMHEVAKAGHWVQQEYPDEVNRVLVDWLTRRIHP